jgi:hypothetical protein
MQVFEMRLLGELLALSIATVVTVYANADPGVKYILTPVAKNIWPAYVYKVVDFKRPPNVSNGNTQ